MLTNVQHGEIRDAIDQVCNRETDVVNLEGVSVERRINGGDIMIHLYCDKLNLEPEDDD